MDSVAVLSFVWAAVVVACCDFWRKKGEKKKQFSLSLPIELI